MRQFLWFTCSQIASYALFYLATRSATQAHLSSALVFDALYATVQFWAIRRISESKRPAVAFAGYLLGSLLGTLLGVRGSVWLLGQ